MVVLGWPILLPTKREQHCRLGLEFKTELMSTKDLQFNCFPFLVPYGEKPSLFVVYVHTCT